MQVSVSQGTSTRSWHVQSLRAQTTRPVSSGGMRHAVRLSSQNNWTHLESLMWMGLGGTIAGICPIVVMTTLSIWNASIGEISQSYILHAH